MVMISANDDGSKGGTYFNHPTLGLCFTPTASITVTTFEVRWGSSANTVSGRHVHLATAAAPATPLSSVEAFDFNPAKTDTWEVVTIDTPVTLTGGIEYVIAIDQQSTGVAYKSVGTSTFVGLTATRFLEGASWNLPNDGYTGGFRLYSSPAALPPATNGWGAG